MDTSLKRIIAYIIDIIVVTIFATLIGKIKTLNPSMDAYNKTYDEYVKLTEKYEKKKIEQKDYEKQMIDLNYRLSKENVYTGIITVSSLVVYFGIVQWILKGQTVGKKILKLKVVSNKDKKLNIGHYLLRTTILNNVIFRVAIMVGPYFMGKQTYYTYSSALSLCESVIESVILLMVVMRKDNRGLHDLVAGTKVICLANDELPEENKKPEKVVKAKFTEVKEKEITEEKNQAKKTNKTSKNNKKVSKSKAKTNKEK